jgi:arylsulfatase A-like enzyme
LIIVTADNGCSPAVWRGDPDEVIEFRMGDAGAFDPAKHYASDIQRGHKADIYEGGHRVPYLVRWDGKVKPGSVCDETVCLVDLYATCADLVGETAADHAAEDSVSLLPLYLGTAEAPVRDTVVHHSINGSFAIRQGDWKLALCPGSGGWSSPRPWKKDRENAVIPNELEAWEWVQLFNLANDPAETKNLAKQHPEKVEQLTALMRECIKDGRSTPGAPQKNTGGVNLYPRWIHEHRP